MRVAVIMPTIRAQAGRVAELFLDDARSSGIDPGDVSFYFSIDPPLVRGALRIAPGYASRLRSVRYIDGDRRAVLAAELTARCGLDPAVPQRAIGQQSYAAARNAALLEALRDGNDVAVFVDDDVYPLAPQRNAEGSGIEWRGTGFVHTHVAQLAAGADITMGGYLGYSAPLLDLAPMLSATCREALGLALSLGSEVLHPTALPTRPRFGC
jgi:hypothetical protein